MKNRHLFLMFQLYLALGFIMSVSAGASSKSSVRHRYLDTFISKMTPEEKIGQLLMVGVKDKGLTPRTEKLIQDLKLGGVILFSHNVKHPSQVRDFVSGLQKVSLTSSKIPMFISVDQEGGSVARIRNQAQVMPTAMAIGATKSSQFSYLAGKMTGLDLATLGINMNLAPVLDVNTEEDNHVIGVRSYGDSPELVAQLGIWYVEGLQSQGIVATAKHFPGHGNTVGDSHYSTPVLKRRLSDLESFQLIPFQRAVNNGLDAIMTAHIAVPSLDPSGLPATLSYNMLTTLVRKRMNFKGLIITDDLEMKSVMNQYPIEDAALKSIQAGADIIIIGWTDVAKRKVYQKLLEAYKNGTISEGRLNTSLKRVLALKIKRKLWGVSSFRKSASPMLKTLKHRVHKTLAKKIASRAITLVKNRKRVLPLRQNDVRRVLLVSPLSGFHRTFAHYYDLVTPVKIASRPTVVEMRHTVDLIAKKAKKADLLVFGVTHQSQLGIINRIAGQISKPIVVVSFGSPYFINKLTSKVNSYVCSYGTQKELIKATAEVLTGIIKPKGVLPVSVSKKGMKGKVVSTVIPREESVIPRLDRGI